MWNNAKTDEDDAVVFTELQKYIAAIDAQEDVLVKIGRKAQMSDEEATFKKFSGKK